MASCENKYITLLDLSRQAKVITGETACFDGKIQAGIPFSGYPTGVDTGTTVSLGIVSQETSVFSGNTGTTIFDVSNTGSTNYDAIFSGYSGTVWTNALFSGNTSGLTLPITPLSADSQFIGPIWTLTQTGMTGDYVIGTQYTGYSITYSFSQVAVLPITAYTAYSGFTSAIQENFSADTLDYKGPLDYISTKEDATVEGILTTKKLTVTDGASASTIGYVLTQLDSSGRAGWVFNSASASTNTFVTGGTLNGTNLDLTWNTGGSVPSIDFSSLSGETFTGNTSGDCITDLYLTNLYGCSPLHIEPSGLNNVYIVENGGNVGIGTTGATEKLHVSGGDILVEGSNGKFYTDLSNSVFRFSAGTSDLTTLGISTPSSGSLVIGTRGSTEPTFTGYGKQGDGFLYSSAEQNGLNIISQQGTSKDDYIRFYVGQSSGAVPANTPDIHIQGSGVTRGNVGINTKTPTEKLHVEGSIKMVDGNESNGYVLTSDANGVGSWVASSGSSGNFANTDLTLTGNRVHDLSGYTATFKDDTNGQTRISVENLFNGVNANSSIGLLGRGPGAVTVSGTIQYGGDSYTGFSSFTDGGSGLLTNALTLATGGGSASSRGHINIGSRRGADAEVRIFNGSGDFDFNSLRAKFTTTGFTSYQDVYIDNLPSESLLGTDANGKIIAGTGGGTFTGNTSGDCITDLYLTNLYGCSPITINDNLQHISSSATGVNSIAWGSGTTASGFGSHAEGFNTIASGIGSHAEGFNTIASGITSHAEGNNTIAGGAGSHAEGSETIAKGNYSHAEGGETIASGLYSHAEGYNTSATTTSHAEGQFTLSNAVTSHAEGTSTTASGDYSHAEGWLTTASGESSHAEGTNTIASGVRSHAGGEGSTASGVTSFIHSSNSLVTGDRSVVLGGQNITGTTDDTVYVPILNINNIVSGGTSVNNLGIDASGNVVTGTAGGGGTDVTTAATTTIDFSGLTYHYDSVTPATGNITENLTGAKLGLIQKIYHNDVSEPTYPSGWVLMGDAIYFTSTLNIIYAEWAGGTRVEYWYVQEQ